MNNYPPSNNGLRPKLYQSNAPVKPAAPTPTTAPIPVGPDLRAKFQLPAQPESVAKIGNLVRGREKASMEEITEIVATSSSGVTQRLISMAYPRKDARLGATVQMATSRLGVNRVIVVMVCELLTKAVVETFETMVNMPLELEDNSTLSLADHGFLTGSVRFTGETNGVVTIAFSPHFSLMIGAHLLGGTMDDEFTSEAINDAIGELVNIVTGNLQSKLCDAGLTSTVGLPEVSFQRTLPKESVPGGSVDQFFFKHGMHNVAVCLSIDPSAPKITAPPPSNKPLRAPPTQGNSWRANSP